MKKFKKNNLDKKDHERIEKVAKVVKKTAGGIGAAGMIIIAILKAPTKIDK